MSLTVHQVALRLAKHIGVTAFDPGDPSNTPSASQGAGLRDGDIEYIVASINGALQELNDWAPGLAVAERAITAADVGGASDPGVGFAVPTGWEESVVLPLALQRFTAHPSFLPASAKAEIARQAGVARRIVQGVELNRRPVQMVPAFR
ncbi:MAG: hypothetical protein WCP06_03015 [Verrucomicrobiota bacterium]